MSVNLQSTAIRQKPNNAVKNSDLTPLVNDLVALNDAMPIGGGVQSVTGNIVDNTDPLNPVITGINGTMTANYLPKASDSNTVSDSIIAQVSNNIGINYVGGAIAGTKVYIDGGTTGANTYAMRIDGDSSAIVNIHNDGRVFYNGAVGIGSTPSDLNTKLIVTGSTSNNTKYNTFFRDLAGNNLLAIRNDGNIGVNLSLGAIDNTKFYIDGGTLASNTYAMRIDGNSNAIMYIRNDGRINVPTLPTSNVGLATGDMYVDTAANILANGDKVVGWKV